MILTDDDGSMWTKDLSQCLYSTTGVLGTGFNAPTYGSCVGLGAVGQFYGSSLSSSLIAFQCPEEFMFNNVHSSKRSDLSRNNISHESDISKQKNNNLNLTNLYQSLCHLTK